LYARIAPALLLAMAGRPGLDALRSIARALSRAWDLLEARVIAAPVEELPELDVKTFTEEAHRLAALKDQCTADEDRFLPDLEALDAWADRLATAPDDPARFSVITDAAELRFRYGRRD